MNPQGQQPPHYFYKQELKERIAALAPTSLLDVGCGDGGLLRSLMGKGGTACTGLETDEHTVERLRVDGLDARLGYGEALPFADGSMDVVVFEYVAHHLSDLQTALREAIRVARRAVFVLDPWYDLAIASQQVAHDVDLWMKQIDRKTGMVHNPNPTTAELAAPFLAAGGFRIDYSHRLVLQPISQEALEAMGRAKLALGSDAGDELALATLLARARTHGISNDGAVCFSAVRT